MKTVLIVKKIKKITVIGLGLLGGSMALALKDITNAKFYGIDTDSNHIKKAISLGIIDQASSLSDSKDADVVIIAIPVNHIPDMAIKVLDNIGKDALVFDVGSTKHSICKMIATHPKRGNYVAAHPIAGTEFSGPEAAFPSLFDGKKNILCDTDKTNPEVLKTALNLFEGIGMKTDFMESASHDKHIAYVSHLSHISSFMLGKTVMEIEKDEKNIFNMAGSGFESTVRLAKSSPDTWTPIFIENKVDIIKSLDEYIINLQKFKSLIANNETATLFKVMKSINHIKDILK